MSIDQLFEMMHGMITMDDLIPFRDLGDDQKIKTWAEETGMALPDRDLLLAGVEFLGMDLNDFYLMRRGTTPYCYYKDCVLVEIITMNEDYLTSFQIKERIEKQTEVMQRYADNQCYSRLLAMVDKRIIFTVYETLYHQIPDEQKYPLFIDIYTRSEYGFGRLNPALVRDVFARRSPQIFDLAASQLPVDQDGNVTIYRGMGSDSTPVDRAYSWTTQLSTAIYFANRFGLERSVYQAKVAVDLVVDFITARNESEVLVLPEDIKELTELPMISFADAVDDLEEGGLTDLYHAYYEKMKPRLFARAEGIHGVVHAQRVLFLALLIGYYEGVSNEEMTILCRAATYHDIGRAHDHEDEDHGRLSYAKMMKLRLEESLDLNDQETLRFIMENHCIQDDQALHRMDRYAITDRDRAIWLFKIFKDCDGLDLVRIRDLDPSYLRIPVSQRLIGLAYELLRGIK